MLLKPPAAAGEFRSRPWRPASAVEIDRLLRFWSAPTTTFDPLPLMLMASGAEAAVAAEAAAPALEFRFIWPAFTARDDPEVWLCGPEMVSVPGPVLATAPDRVRGALISWPAGGALTTSMVPLAPLPMVSVPVPAAMVYLLALSK